MLNKIKEERIKAIKENDKEMKIACQMIVGEIGRLEKKDVNDSNIIKIINKLIKSELITLEYPGQDENENDYIKCLKYFLPKMTGEYDIRIYLKTIDFSKLKNKMQAIAMCKTHFGNDCVNSNLVKNIIEKEY